MKSGNDVIQFLKIYLREHYAELFHQAYTDDESREVLKRIILNEHGKYIDSEEKADDILREIVGLSFIDELVKNDKRITDIGFDGGKLIVEGNGFHKYSIDEISEDDINKLIAKFSNATGKELTAKDSILNTSMNHLRLNAVHKQNAVNGTTMAIRVSKPKLALNLENFEEFAPDFMLEFIKAAVKTRCNVFISGDTGTGKTELQKLIMSLVPFEERIALIETNKDLYAKELFPDKDIFYWVANESATVEELISYAALRSNPIWIMVGEVVGREVLQMLQGILTGHKFTTTLHSVDARAIPKRLLGMAKMGYTFDEKMFLDDIYNYTQFGYHLEKKELTNGKTLRYLSEVVEYHSDHTATTVFEQTFTEREGFKHVVGNLSEEFMKRVEKYDLDYMGLPTTDYEVAY